MYRIRSLNFGRPHMHFLTSKLDTTLLHTQPDMKQQ